MFIPCGDTLIIEKEVLSSNILIPDSAEIKETDIFIVKAVGKGYVTEQGGIIPPEQIIGDKVIVMGKVLKLKIKTSEVLLCRASDVVALERG